MSDNSQKSGVGATLRPHPVTPEEAADRAALQHLAAAYCHGVDRRDWALVRSLYHDDAIDDHRPFFIGSAEDYCAWLPSMMANWRRTAHSIDNMLFLIDGDRAEGEMGAKTYHETLDGSKAIIAYGRYCDRYEKRGGVWKYAHRCFVLDWTQEHDLPPPSDFAEGVRLGAAGVDDPVYDALPMIGADRQTRG